MSENILVAKNIKKYFPIKKGFFLKHVADVKAVDDVSLTVKKGETLGLVGESGCGKSTLGRTLIRLYEPTAGEITFEGQNFLTSRGHDLRKHRKDIQMIFQDPYASLDPRMTIGQIIEQPFVIHNILKPAEREAKVKELLQLVGLRPSHINRYPHEFSGGQRQRVAMGRAIVRMPKVYLFDEPLSNLDAKLRAQTRLEIQKLHADLGTTSLFVTHDQVEAMTLAQRMIVMNAGVVEQVGTPEQVYLQPATTFVASFIGSPPMNLVKGVVKGDRFEFGVGSVVLPVAAPRQGPLTLGMRPEHADIVGDDPSGWRLQVEVVEMLGAERLVYGRLCGESFTLRIDAMRPAPRPGDILTLKERPEHLHWFDSDTGMRVPS